MVRFGAKKVESLPPFLFVLNSIYYLFLLYPSDTLLQSITLKKALI